MVRTVCVGSRRADHALALLLRISADTRIDIKRTVNSSFQGWQNALFNADTQPLSLFKCDCEVKEFYTSYKISSSRLNFQLTLTNGIFCSIGNKGRSEDFLEYVVRYRIDLNFKDSQR